MCRPADPAVMAAAISAVRLATERVDSTDADPTDADDEALTVALRDALTLSLARWPEVASVAATTQAADTVRSDDGQAVWLEPLLGGEDHGPYKDEIEASNAMDDLGLTDATHKLVWRYGAAAYEGN